MGPKQRPRFYDNGKVIQCAFAVKPRFDRCAGRGCRRSDSPRQLPRGLASSRYRGVGRLAMLAMAPIPCAFGARFGLSTASGARDASLSAAKRTRHWSHPLASVTARDSRAPPLRRLHGLYNPFLRIGEPHACRQEGADIRRRPSRSRPFPRRSPRRQSRHPPHEVHRAQHSARVRRHGHGDGGPARHHHGAGGGTRHHPQKHACRAPGGRGRDGQALRVRRGQGSADRAADDVGARGRWR